MWYALAADVVVLLHLAFIVFVVGGAAVVWRWPRAAWLHLPAAAWGVLIELRGWICPLTPLENHLRRQAGVSDYPGGFIEHYVVPIVYPSGLTSRTQLVLGLAVLVVNAVAYTWLITRWRRRAA